MALCSLTQPAACQIDETSAPLCWLPAWCKPDPSNLMRHHGQASHAGRCVQALAPVAEEEPDLATAQQKPASHALKPTASLSDPFGSLALEEPVHVNGAAHEAEAPEQLVEVDAGTMVQVCGLLTHFAAIKIETGAGTSHALVCLSGFSHAEASSLC